MALGLALRPKSKKFQGQQHRHCLLYSVLRTNLHSVKRHEAVRSRALVPMTARRMRAPPRPHTLDLTSRRLRPIYSRTTIDYEHDIRIRAVSRIAGARGERRRDFAPPTSPFPQPTYCLHNINIFYERAGTTTILKEYIAWRSCRRQFHCMENGSSGKDHHQARRRRRRRAVRRCPNQRTPVCPSSQDSISDALPCRLERATYAYREYRQTVVQYRPKPLHLR